jgi:hypothetical protein
LVSAADERERVVHRLAELLTVALSNAGIVRAEAPKLTAVGKAAMDDLEVALRKAAELFPELRRVM